MWECKGYVHNGLGYTPGDPINIDGAINNGQPLNKHQVIKDPQNFKAKEQPANSSADLLNPMEVLNREDIMVQMEMQKWI